MNIIYQIRLLMEKNRHLKKLAASIQKTKIMMKRREKIYAERAREGAEAFAACYGTHKSEFEKVAKMLEDDFSRKTLQAIIDYRLDPRGGGTEGRNRNAAIL